jgi:hypothetical protein
MSPAAFVCSSCKHYQETTLFELCMHTESKYTAGGKTDQHTANHMRQRGGCGQNATLYEAR